MTGIPRVFYVGNNIVRVMFVKEPDSISEGR